MKDFLTKLFFGYAEIEIRDTSFKVDMLIIWAILLVLVLAVWRLA